jgi:hypothetical protein
MEKNRWYHYLLMAVTWPIGIVLVIILTLVYILDWLCAEPIQDAWAKIKQKGSEYRVIWKHFKISHLVLRNKERDR